MNKPYNDVNSYIFGLQQCIKLINLDYSDDLTGVIEELQRGTHENQEISSFLKGLRDGLIWYRDSEHENKEDMFMNLSIILNQIRGKCFD